MRLLVTGAGGMLGADLLAAGKRAGHEVVGMGRGQLDVTDERAVEQVLSRVEPEAVVNCAAWTEVDRAEGRREEAFALNASAVGYLAETSAQLGAMLAHISTDYVFDGVPPHNGAGLPRAYLESDPTGPRSVYGESKLAGERLALAASARHLVVRTAWLFGTAGGSFAATMLNLAGEREAVQVVSDQRGCPTWTGHLAPALVGLIEREVGGLVHLAGAGNVSWNGFAREIFRQAEIECVVEDALSADMARPAPRPAWSALETEREDVIPLPPWQDGLAGYLAALAGVRRV